MTRIALLCLLSALCAAAQCVETNTSGCTSALAASGVISGSSPSITAIYNAQYSTRVDSAAQKADVFYNTAYSVSSTVPCIAANAHEGGGTAGDKGNFISAGMSDYVVISGWSGCTIITGNYTLNTGTSPGMSPTQQIELSCFVHWIVHNAGVLFPGNVNDIRIIGFSWGQWFANMTNLALDQWTPNCEVSDAVPPVKVIVGVAQVWSFPGEYGNGTYSAFNTAVTSMLGSSPSTPAMNAVSPASYLASGKARIVNIQGPSDGITPAVYQSSPMFAAYQALTPPTTITLSMPASPCGGGQGHGSDWANCGSYLASQAYNQFKTALLNTGSIGVNTAGGIGQ